MKIFVVGPTGGTGLCVVEQALRRGWIVKALARTEGAKLKALQHENLEVVIGELTSMSGSELSGHMAGCDAVLSALGSRKVGFWITVTIYSDTIKIILDAMRQAGLTRLICVSSWCTTPSPADPFIMRWIARPLFLGKLLEDMARMEDYLEKNANEINYTVVRPPQLKNGPVTTAEILKLEATLITDNVNFSMCRANVARFMLACLDDDGDESLYQKMFAVGEAK